MYTIGAQPARNIPNTEWKGVQKAGVRKSYEKQLAGFLRRRRGELTFAAFAKRLGIPPSTLFRLEQCQQSITLGRLEQITKRMGVTLRDIFPDG